MVTTSMPSRVVRKLAACITAFSALVACGPVYNLYAPPGATIHSSLGRNYSHPDEFLYKGMPTISFRAKQDFRPPEPWYLGRKQSRPMADILASDQWVVTHRIGSEYLAYSESFQSRQAKLRDKFGAPYLFYLVIDGSGTVSGWQTLLDPKIVSKSERMTVMSVDAIRGGDWSVAPAFDRLQ